MAGGETSSRSPVGQYDPSVQTRDPRATRPTTIRWYVAVFAAVICFLDYLFRTNLAVAGPAMMRGLGITQVQLGLAFSAFAWVYGLCQVPGGVACQIIGPRRAITALLAGWGVITLLTGLIPGSAVAPVWLVLAALVALRAVLGVLQAAIFPAIQGPVLIQWLPPGRWALATSLTSVGLTLGGAVAGPIVIWLVLDFGWRQSFVFTAPILFVFAAAWWWFFRDDPAQHPWVNPEEIALIGERRAAGAHVDWRRDLRVVFANRDVIALTVSYFLLSYEAAFFYNWIPTYLTDIRHIGAAASGVLTGAMWLAGAGCAVAGGLLTDRLCGRHGNGIGCRLIGLISVPLMVPLLVAGAHAHGSGAMFTLLALAFGLSQFTDAAYWVAAMRVAGPRTAAATGLMNSGAAAALGVGSLAFPLMGRHIGWDHAIDFSAILVLMSAICWPWIAADRVMAEPNAATMLGASIATPLSA
jgi:sugar phosphate permease